VPARSEMVSDIWLFNKILRKCIIHSLTADFGSCRTSTFFVVLQLVGDAPTLARDAG